MGMMRTIIDWCDEKYDKAHDDFGNTKARRKASAAAFIEGACDGAILMYVPVVIACYIWQHKATKK